MYQSHIQCKKYELNTQINVNASKKNNKVTIKSYFVISYLVFQSSIPTQIDIPRLTKCIYQIPLKELL